MSVLINKIEIQNFRSIRKLSLKAEALTILVGKNDCGKSNILRALNLFFNGHTNSEQPLIFDNDFNFYHTPPAKKPREIIIKLELQIPESYRATNGDFVIWEKRWRSDAGNEKGRLDKDTCQGVRISEGRNGAKKHNLIEIQPRTKIYELLRRIEFCYVPAVRDPQYFDRLRGKIYEIISKVATDNIRKSSENFERAIAQQLTDLTGDIEGSFGFNTNLSLPKDLTHIFEKLDFLSGEKQVSLESRGDGIKARHIPLILKFMNSKKSSVLDGKRGATPYSFIWGYEEPENNLEFSSAKQLADEFLSIAIAGDAQVLLTTHSPVFYNTKNESNSAFVVCHHLCRMDEEKGTINDDVSNLDASLGVLDWLAPKYKELESIIKARKENERQAKLLAGQPKPVIFVEGESDKHVLYKALQVFKPGYEDKVIIEWKKGAGNNFVIDRIHAWKLNRVHNINTPKAIGVLDDDVREILLDAEKVTIQLFNNKMSGHSKLAVYQKNKLLINAYRKEEPIYRIPVVLENLYPVSFLQTLSAEYREARSKDEIISIIPKCVRDKALDSGGYEALIDDQFKEYVLYKVVGTKKVAVAKKIYNLNNEEAKPILESMSFDRLVEEIITYLFDG